MKKTFLLVIGLIFIGWAFGFFEEKTIQTYFGPTVLIEVSKIKPKFEERPEVRARRLGEERLSSHHEDKKNKPLEKEVAPSSSEKSGKNTTKVCSTYDIRRK